MWVRLYNQATEVATEEKGLSILDLVTDCKSVTNKNQANQQPIFYSYGPLDEIPSKCYCLFKVALFPVFFLDC